MFHLLKKANVFAPEPLGIRHSDFDPEVARTLGPWARVYQIEDGELVIAQELPGVWPSGSLHTTALDLLRFARMVNSHGTLGGRTVLERNTVAEMLELQSRVVPGAEAGFGLGFRIVAYRGSTAWCHEGANPGSSARLCALPEQDLIVAVLLNRDDSVARMEVTNEILRVFMELPPADVRLGDASRWGDLIGHYEVLDPIPDVLPGLGWLADVEAVVGPAGLELRRGSELLGRLNPTDSDHVFELRGGIGDGELAYVRVDAGGSTEIRAAVFRMRRWPGGIRPWTVLLGLASVGTAIGSLCLLYRLRRRRS